MKRYLNLIFIFVTCLFVFHACDDDDTIVGGGFDEPDPLIGCEATTFYDWSDFTFETSLDGGAKTWLGFELEEKGIPRRGYDLVNEKNEKIGYVTSGTMSPYLNRAIGIGFIYDNVLFDNFFIKLHKKNI